MVNEAEFEVEVKIETWTGREGNEMQTPRVVKVYSKIGQAQPQPEKKTT